MSEQGDVEAAAGERREQRRAAYQTTALDVEHTQTAFARSVFRIHAAGGADAQQLQFALRGQAAHLEGGHGEGCGSEVSASDVRRIARAAGCLVGTEGIQVEVVGLLGAGELVLIRLAPGIRRDILPQIRAMPTRLARHGRHQNGQPFLAAGIAADIQAELIQRLGQDVDLRPGRGDFGFADVAEQARADDAGEQADDDQDDEEFEEGEAFD